MSSVDFSTSDISSTFPIPVADMPKIATATSRPTRITLQAFQDALNANACAIPSKSNSATGHLGLVLSVVQFRAINNNVDFVVPAFPVRPTHSTNATARAAKEADDHYKIQLQEHTIFVNTKTKLRNMILASVPQTYIYSLKNPITQYMHVEPFAIMNHLWMTYGEVSAEDLIINQERMNAPWNPPDPIETLYERMIEGQSIARHGNEIIDDSTLVRWSYAIFQKTGMFSQDLKEWRQRPEANKTWSEFQVFFAQRDNDRRQTNATTGSTGYSANATQIKELVHQEVGNVLDQWLQADQHGTQGSAQDDTAPPPSTDSANAALTIEALKKEMQSMIQQLIPKNGSQDKQNKQKAPLVAQGFDDDGTPITYCWSHGITKNLRHSSMTCSRKKEGHKDAATLQNKMGGCTDRCQARTKSNA
jgi:hypothetical protein